jgi:hypothetical protein
MLQYLHQYAHICGRLGHDYMVVGFTTTYHGITTDVVGSTPSQGEVYSIM